MSAIGNNESISLNTVKLRDNFISGHAGELLLDALHRNKSLTIADFRGNQVDQVRLHKIKTICNRNFTEIKDAEPRRLRKEIVRLRGEQVKLRNAEKTLKSYLSAIEETKQKIAEIESAKAEFVKIQNTRRNDIKNQISKEQANISMQKAKLDQQQKELEQTEQSYQTRLLELSATRAREVEARKSMEETLAKIKKQLEQSISDRPRQVEELKQAISDVKVKKTECLNQCANIQKELARLQQMYRDGQPIPSIIEQAKALLLRNDEIVREREQAEREAAGM